MIAPQSRAEELAKAALVPLASSLKEDQKAALVAIQVWGCLNSAAQQKTFNLQARPIYAPPHALAAKNRELVAQHHDLELFELTRAQTERRDGQRSPKQQVQQRHDQAAASLNPNPKKPTLRLWTPLRRTASGTRRNYVPHGLHKGSILCCRPWPRKHCSADAVGVFDHEQRSAGRAVDCARTEPLHGRGRCRHPECCVADAELRDDVVPLADRFPENGKATATLR